MTQRTIPGSVGEAGVHVEGGLEVAGEDGACMRSGRCECQTSSGKGRLPTAAWG